MVEPGLSKPLRSRGATASATPTTEALRLDPVVRPSAHEVYDARTTFLGKSHAFRVSFAGAAEVFGQYDLRFDLQTAELVRSDGVRLRLAWSEERDLQTGTVIRPAWLISRPYAPDGVPRGMLELTAKTDGAGLLTIDAIPDAGFFTGLEMFTERKFPLPQLGPAPFALVSRTEYPDESIEVFPGVRIYAPSGDARLRAAEAFEEINGHALAEVKARGTASLQLEVDRLQSLRREVGSVAKAAGDWRALLAEYPACRDTKSVESADQTIADRLEQLTGLQTKVEVFVVPRGKHFTAMAEIAGVRFGDENISSQAFGFTSTNTDPIKVFVPEEDLFGDQRTIRHELHHLLLKHYLAPGLRRIADRIEQDTRRQGGPFAREYGVNPGEFWTTMAELFEGVEGPQGREWMARRQPELFRVFTIATGRFGHLLPFERPLPQFSPWPWPWP